MVFVARPGGLLLKTVLQLQLGMRRESIARREIDPPKVLTPANTASRTVIDFGEELLILREDEILGIIATNGAGAKSNHLAYLGDSTIGAGCNIGAGTITCNYDGEKKHRTTIGERAFIGSNATLVAPVEIGAGSYVAAGSVITDAVPPEALALGRARQVLKPGWKKKR